eukprot:4120909-Pleurochrysis_carterae.AAC.1
MSVARSRRVGGKRRVVHRAALSAAFQEPEGCVLGVPAKERLLLSYAPRGEENSMNACTPAHGAAPTADAPRERASEQCAREGVGPPRILTRLAPLANARKTAAMRHACRPVECVRYARAGTGAPATLAPLHRCDTSMRNCLSPWFRLGCSHLPSRPSEERTRVQHVILQHGTAPHGQQLQAATSPKPRESLEKEGGSKAEALACVRVFSKPQTKNCQSPSQPKIVKHQAICHSNQASVACEESTLKLRERCASLACKESSFRAEPRSKLSDTSARKSQKSEKQKRPRGGVG